MRNIHVLFNSKSPSNNDIEIVERKGLGHPDTLIDGIVEEVSINLCKAYINEFGKILHHNIDKGLLIGGKTEVDYGGGKFIEPIDIYIAGRADPSLENINEIAIEAAKNYIKNIKHLSLDNVNIKPKIRPGSKELTELFLRNKMPLANDTSVGVGFYPLTKTEQIALNAELSLNNEAFKSSHPYIGEDIKIMVERENQKINLIAAVAFVSKYILSIEEYIDAKESIKEAIEQIVESIWPYEYEVFVNTADDEANESIYLTLSGTSAEAGDDGSVGRGNRASGLITPYRLMTLEATAGKNPVNHVGKIYSILSFEIAKEIYNELGVEAQVMLLSQIGKPIDKPKVASIQINSNDEKDKKRAYEITDSMLEDITSLTKLIIEKKVKVFY